MSPPSAQLQEIRARLGQRRSATSQMMNQLSQQLLEMPIEDQVDADDGGFLNFMTIPAKKCSKCEEKGITVWVVPGKCCPDCGALVD